MPLASVVADVEVLVRPQLAAKGLAFDHDACGPDTPDQPHVVRADPERLRQALLDLLGNATKLTDAGGRVSLACATDAPAGVVRVRVTDTGRGIAEERLASICEPCVQVDRLRTPEGQQGVGPGLAISRDLARGMGGVEGLPQRRRAPLCRRRLTEPLRRAGRAPARTAARTGVPPAPACAARSTVTRPGTHGGMRVS